LKHLAGHLVLPTIAVDNLALGIHDQARLCQCTAETAMGSLGRGVEPHGLEIPGVGAKSRCQS